MKKAYVSAAKALVISVGLFLMASCHESDPENTMQKNQLATNVIVPSTTFYTSTISELTIQGKGFQENDKFYLRNSRSEDTELSMLAIEPNYITFEIPDDIESGEFVLVLKRGAREQKLGILKLRLSINLDVPDKDNATIKGAVFCGTKAVEGAVVSDGKNVTVTDGDGYYWLESDKYHGYVFVSFPSGYEPLMDGVIPLFWSNLTEDAQTTEQHNFELVEVDNKEHIVLAFADMHLANRDNKDIDQFRRFFVSDVLTTADYTYAGKKLYALNLGDMSWDTYWYSGRWGVVRYDISSYRSLINSLNFSMPIFHLPGNHDNDPYLVGDFAAEQPYKNTLGPTYYSFNLGDIHYVMLDDNIYNNTGAVPPNVQGDRDYLKALTDIQLEWLKRDLANVDKTKPVVVGIHCPVYYFNSSLNVVNALSSEQDRANLLECLNGFETIHFLSGHTHNNVSMKVSENVFEHNTGAVCATWWWSGYHTSGDGWRQICKDGSPGGYGVYEMSGTDIEWYYKGNQEPRSRQFRAYDMNVVKTFFNTNPNAERFYEAFPNRKGEYDNVADNVVFINVWNWDPDWKITVKEGNTPLTVTRIYHKDPLHTICYDVPRYIQYGAVTTDFVTSNNYHLFYVTCSNPSSTLQIDVEDRFGNVYSEQMQRPKDFTVTMN